MHEICAGNQEHGQRCQRPKSEEAVLFVPVGLESCGHERAPPVAALNSPSPSQHLFGARSSKWGWLDQMRHGQLDELAVILHRHTEYGYQDVSCLITAQLVSGNLPLYEFPRLCQP